MRLVGLSAGLLACTLLGACAAPPALQIASFAVDGVAFLVTGKGSTDHALSVVADADCRLSNAVHGRELCSPWAEMQESETRTVAAFAPDLPSRADIEPLRSTGAVSGIAVSFHQSPGMNMAEITGAPVDADLEGRVAADGTLQVYLVTAKGARAAVPTFVVPGYARAPGVFTGVVMGARFFAPESFVR